MNSIEEEKEEIEKENIDAVMSGFYTVRDVEEDVKYLKELVDDFMYSVSSYKRSVIEKYPDHEFRSAELALYWLDTFLEGIEVPEVFGEALGELHEMVELSRDALEEGLKYSIVGKTEYEGRELPLARLTLSKEYVKRIRDAMKLFSILIGKKCGSNIPYKDEVTVPELLNDISSCIHVFADTLNTVHEVEKVSEKVYTSKPDRDLLELALAWDEATKFFETRNVYAPLEPERLQGVVVGNRAWFRVGSAPGHVTHVEKKDDKLTIEYYDTDDFVNETMSKLFIESGCRCRTREDEGVFCSCPLDAKRKIAVALSLATSMDYRGANYGEEKMRFEDGLKYIEEISGKILEEVEKVVGGGRGG